jgi:ribosomal protein L25 (general stress protein Ctc)
MDKLILKASERNLDIKLQDLRLSKQIPAVIYGKKIKPIHICLNYSDFLKTFRT